MSAWVDHLAVAASSLDASTLERVLGVPLAGGGKHDRMGTHNRLLRLGSDAYLELIAIDPAARLPDAGVSLEALELEHPRASDVQRQHDLLGLAFRCAPAPAPKITAHLRTPAGPRPLRSSEPIR